MKTLLIAAVAAAASAAAITGIASGQSSPTTLKFTEKDAYFKYVDVKPFGKEKLSQGDGLAIGGKVKGGSTNLYCVVTRPGKKALFECTGALRTAAGDITVSGISSAAGNDDTYAITGGTGQYAGARGTVESKGVKGKDVLTATFTTS